MYAYLKGTESKGFFKALRAMGFHGVESQFLCVLAHTTTYFPHVLSTLLLFPI